MNKPYGRKVPAVALKKLIALSALEKTCDAAQRTYSACQAWLDRLPTSVVLEAVITPELDGRDLADVRRHIAALEAERNSICNAPPPPYEFNGMVRRYVENIAAAPTHILDGSQLAPRWAPQWETLAWLRPEIITTALETEIARQASSAAQKMPRRERAQRLTIIEQKLDEAAYLEEALITRAIAHGEKVERRADAPPAAILGVRMAKEVMAEERAKRIERRASRAALAG